MLLELQNTTFQSITIQILYIVLITPLLLLLGFPGAILSLEEICPEKNLETSTE